MVELGQAIFGNPTEDHEAPDFIGRDLYTLSEMLGRRDPDAQSHGMLGGEWGYGNEYANDVFEMFPYYWGDCDCGYDQAEAEWDEAHSHGFECYQSVLERRGGYDHADALAADWGLPKLGSAVHCTCEYALLWAAWLEAHQHTERCPVARPNFAHFASGLHVHWYKYIGRGMTANRDVTFEDWQRIYDECRASLRD